MNQTEREIFFKLLIDLFLDQPGRSSTVQEQTERGRDENNKATARARSKPVRKTNAPRK